MKKVSEKRYRLSHPESGYDRRVTVKQFRLPNGMIDTFFVDNNKDSVQIFAITTDDKVIMVKQFRPGTEKTELELPGGGVDKLEDDDLVSAAERELLEETSYAGGSIVYLRSVPYTPYSTGRRHMFLATGCEQVSKKLDLDENEVLVPVLLPIEEARELMKEAGFRGYDCAYLALDKLGKL